MFLFSKDPYDCTTYYQCNGVNAVPSKQKCPSEFIYCSAEKLCKRKPASANCTTINAKCSGSDHKFVTSGSDRAYYALCSAPIVMFKCADEKHYIFEPSTNECVFNCVTTGLIRDPSNCSRYLICEGAGSAAIVQQCPQGFMFNGNACVKGFDCSNVTESSSVGYASDE